MNLVGGAQAILFVVSGFALLLGSVLAIVRVGFLRLESRLGIFRDGLRPGRLAPAWRIADSDGVVRVSPSAGRVQLLAFADHSLREFPDVASELAAIDAAEEAEVLVLTRIKQRLSHEMIRLLGIDAPIIPVDSALYWSYNVRVMPYAIVIDGDGVVRRSGMANTAQAVQSIMAPGPIDATHESVGARAAT